MKRVDVSGILYHRTLEQYRGMPILGLYRHTVLLRNVRDELRDETK